MAAESGAAETCIESGPIMLTAWWLSPGKDEQPISFVKKGHEEAGVCSVMFGSSHVESGLSISDWVQGAGGYQIWVLEDNTQWGLAVGFHHTNSTDEKLVLHWMESRGGGLWRNRDDKTEILVLKSYQAAGMPCIVKPDDGVPVSNLTSLAIRWNLSLQEAEMKIVLEWYHPKKPVAYVCLRKESSVQYMQVNYYTGEGSVGAPNGVWLVVRCEQ